MNPRGIIATYLIVQAIGTLAWWALLLCLPASMAWFQPSGFPAEALLGFWLGDGVLLVSASLVTAWAVLRRSDWASTGLWALAAAVWYPTLYCIGVSLLTDQAWVASAMMVVMALLTLAMATIHGHAQQQPATIRVTPMTKRWAIGWTLAQTVIFWCALLGILPKGIVEIEQRLGWPAFSHSNQTIAAVVLFAAASALGLLSGMTMASRGDGTPLPTATAPKLVIAGPYRWLRNPMAVAGILQGIAVGWYLGSYSVIAYSIVGAFMWHIFVRPIEEADLSQRFGEPYQEYQRQVGLWLPSFAKHKPNAEIHAHSRD